MSFGSFIKKQFIDILQWNETGDGTLAWRYPMQDFEIQNGGMLTVRESQMAVFVNEGKIADVFGPGNHRLTTQTLPILTYLKNWDKLFESPFKSDVYFFSTRLQLGRKWGTPQPVTLRDADFDMVRLRAFGVYSYKLVDPKQFFTEVSGTRELYTANDVEQQLRNLITAGIAPALGHAGVPFLDMAANQGLMGDTLRAGLTSVFERYGLALDSFAVESISLPDDLQKAIDTRISMGMVGDMNRYTQYQVAQSIPLAAQNEGGLAGTGASLAAGLAFGQVMAGGLTAGTATAAHPAPAVVSDVPASMPAPAPEPVAPVVDSPEARLGQLKGLLDRGLISAADYDGAKTEILKKLIG